MSDLRKYLMLVAIESDSCPLCMGNGFVSGFSFDDGSYSYSCTNCHGTGVFVESEENKKKAKEAMTRLLADCPGEL